MKSSLFSLVATSATFFSGAALADPGHIGDVGGGHGHELAVLAFLVLGVVVGGLGLARLLGTPTPARRVARVKARTRR